MNILAPTLLLCLVYGTLAGQSLTPHQPDQVVVTVPENLQKLHKARKLHRARIQFQTDSNQLSVRISQKDKLPIKKVRLMVQAGGEEFQYTWKKDSMLAVVGAEQAGVWPVIASMYELKKGSREEKNYAHSVGRYAAGKSGGLTMASQWLTLGKAPLPAPPTSVRAKISSGWFRKTVFTTDTQPMAGAYLLPAVDKEPCEPLDRFYERRKQKGYGIEKFSYVPYIRSQQKVTRKTFEIYFEKNKATAAPEGLTAIAEFLRNNNLSILHASMEGFSSVEGTAERNRELQQQRARKLMYALQKFNDVPVLSDTILFTDAWAPFREELKRSPHASLDSLPDEDLRARINADPGLAEYFEPYFRQHRKATLVLTLTGTISQEEVVKRLVSDFNYHLNKLKAGDTPDNRKVEAQLLGMIDYFDKLSLAGKTDSMSIASLVDQSAWPSAARILMFYHVVKSYEEKKVVEFQWDSTFVRRNWNNLFAVAADNAIGQMQGCNGCRFTTMFVENKKRAAQLVDIQYYTFKYIREGILNPDVLCSIEYPKTAKYYGFKLNHMAMAWELSKERYFSCYGFGPASHTKVVADLRPDSVKLDSLIQVAVSAPVVVLDNPAQYLRPTFDQSEKGDYYYYIKLLAQGKGADVRQFVRTSDSWFEFDLFYLLRVNIDEWNPHTNYFYDEEIQVVQMRELVSLLKSMDKRICGEDVNQLYLDFYVKSLHYLDLHRTPGDNRQMNLADQSLRSIVSYYAARPRMLFPKLILHVVRELHRFYWIPTRKSSVEYAYTLMAKAESRRLLSHEEQAIWNTYMKLFPPPRRSYRPREQTVPVVKPVVSKRVAVVAVNSDR